MGNLLIFLIDRLIFRISNFLRHWYVLSFKIYTNFVISIFEKMDKVFALKITYKNLFSPLYSDRSVFGYFFGFVFRIIRLFLGIIVYIFLVIVAVIVYLIWAAIPLIIIYKIIKFSPSIKMLRLENMGIFK